MFTGIVEEIGEILSSSRSGLVIKAEEVLKDLKPGDSIAVNGACLTVRSLDSTSFSVDLMPETVRQTNLGLLNYGDEVNLERPLPLGGRLGGHLVQGHVDATGRVVWARPEGEAILLRFEAPSEVMRYIVKRGFVAVDGVSLTVTDFDSSTFQVSLVPFTQKHTTLGRRKVGDLVNLEADMVAKYLEKFSQFKDEGISYHFLAEHGFLS